MRGERVVELRQALDLTRAEFARLVGVHHSVVQRWETSDEIKTSGPGQMLAVISVLPLRRHAVEITGALTRGALYARFVLLGLYFHEAIDSHALRIALTQALEDAADARAAATEAAALRRALEGALIDVAEARVAAAEASGTPWVWADDEGENDLASFADGAVLSITAGRLRRLLEARS